MGYGSGGSKQPAKKVPKTPKTKVPKGRKMPKKVTK